MTQDEIIVYHVLREVEKGTDVMDSQIAKYILNMLSNLKDKLVKEEDYTRFYQKIGIALKDKIHRRNMQIKDRDKKIEELKADNKDLETQVQKLLSNGAKF